MYRIHIQLSYLIISPFQSFFQFNIENIRIFTNLSFFYFTVTFCPVCTIQMESSSPAEHLEMNNEDVYVNQAVDNANVELHNSDSDENSDIGDYSSPNLPKGKKRNAFSKIPSKGPFLYYVRI